MVLRPFLLLLLLPQSYKKELASRLMVRTYRTFEGLLSLEFSFLMQHSGEVSQGGCLLL